MRHELPASSVCASRFESSPPDLPPWFHANGCLVNAFLENRRSGGGPRGNRSLSAADAALVRGTESAAIFIRADVPQGHGGSLEDRRESGQNLVHDRGRNGFQFFAATGAEVEGAGLVAADHPGGLGSGTRQRDSEPGRPGKTPSAGHGDNHGQFCHLMERLRRVDQSGTAACFAHAPRRGRARSAGFRRASSENLGARWLAAEPFALFPAARFPKPAWSEEFVQGMAGALLRRRGQPAAFQGDPARAPGRRRRTSGSADGTPSMTCDGISVADARAPAATRKRPTMPPSSPQRMRAKAEAAGGNPSPARNS